MSLSWSLRHTTKDLFRKTVLAEHDKILMLLN